LGMKTPPVVCSFSNFQLLGGDFRRRYCGLGFSRATSSSV